MRSIWIRKFYTQRTHTHRHTQNKRRTTIFNVNPPTQQDKGTLQHQRTKDIYLCRTILL